MKRYLVLVEDTEIKDVLLFMISATSADEARAKARQHYRDNLWDEKTIGRMRTILLKEDRDVQYVGKAGIDTEEKQKQLQAAYELLLSAARWLESEGDTASYDEIFAFLRQSPEGRKVVEAYLHEEGAI